MNEPVEFKDSHACVDYTDRVRANPQIGTGEQDIPQHRQNIIRFIDTAIEESD